jgi:hypothetical protein
VRLIFKPTCGLAATSLLVLHPESRLRLRIFSFKLLFLIPVAPMLAVRQGYPLLHTIFFFCIWNSILTGLAALFRRQRYGAEFLMAWDETAAFLALALLTRLVDGITA